MDIWGGGGYLIYYPPRASRLGTGLGGGEGPFVNKKTPFHIFLRISIVTRIDIHSFSLTVLKKQNFFKAVWMKDIQRDTEPLWDTLEDRCLVHIWWSLGYICWD